MAREYGSVLAKGAYLSEVTKNTNEQTIQEIISLIYPPVKLNQEIFISYVPIVREEEPKKE